MSTSRRGNTVRRETYSQPSSSRSSHPYSEESRNASNASRRLRASLGNRPLGWDEEHQQIELPNIRNHDRNDFQLESEGSSGSNALGLRLYGQGALAERLSFAATPSIPDVEMIDAFELSEPETMHTVSMHEAWAEAASDDETIRSATASPSLTIRRYQEDEEPHTGDSQYSEQSHSRTPRRPFQLDRSPPQDRDTRSVAMGSQRNIIREASPDSTGHDHSDDDGDAEDEGENQSRTSIPPTTRRTRAFTRRRPQNQRSPSPVPSPPGKEVVALRRLRLRLHQQK
ncbi:hypothetical protein M408DRAFT_24661 [Serendipita vermifera MAFF 305830]|uniref:Uncharacterized protein n=1 Tax=Serendipita vermifera MAFF 305830 TaxID=933852 RepID=A0A0C3ARJ8_SERVB|nr:hypothetical protein M408DRAFT_24661 [Serendipita vermifera MAFF 305830]